MGAAYGFLFGWNDIEDVEQGMLKVILMKENRICLVIGVFLGGLGGFVSELTRRNVRILSVLELKLIASTGNPSKE